MESAEQITTVRQQQKEDALRLAEVIYNIFVDTLSNDTIVANSKEGNLNDK